jgi:ABC-type branched-subunit amino acid transport system ATPase component
MLDVEGLVAGYGRTTIIEELSLSVPDEGTVVVLGRNGVGKTTLMRAIVGEIGTREGSIHFAAERIDHLPAYRRARLGIGYVPQGRQIFPTLTVRENLSVGAWAQKLNAAERVEEVLVDFPMLRDKLTARGSSLSGGQQQLLALARAMITSPRLLILDEPTEGVQPSMVDAIEEKIREISGSIAVLLVEQNLVMASRLSEVAYVVDHGTIVRTLRPEQLLSDPVLQREYVGG